MAEQQPASILDPFLDPELGKFGLLLVSVLLACLAARWAARRIRRRTGTPPQYLAEIGPLLTEPALKTRRWLGLALIALVALGIIAHLLNVQHQLSHPGSQVEWTPTFTLGALLVVA